MGIICGSIDVEQPDFEVVATYGDIQVRRYPPVVAAQVDCRSDDNQSFKTLARYIGVFGTPENSGSSSTPQPVAMTAPVVTTSHAPESVAMTAPVASTNETMQFLLPSSLTLDSAPRPTNSAVQLVQLPERTFAVLRYSGSTDLTDAQRRVEELTQLLSQNGADLKLDPNDWQLYRYNPPFTLPFWRTNEIAVKVDQ